MSIAREITHEQLTAAVAATGDLEYAAWVSDPDGYGLRAMAKLNLGAVEVAQVMVDASIPLTFLVARLPGGEVVVTSGHAVGLAAVLAAAGTPPTPDHFFALAREEVRPLELLDTPVFQVSGGVAAISMLVRDVERGDALWKFHLSPESSSFQSTPIPGSEP